MIRKLKQHLGGMLRRHQRRQLQRRLPGLRDDQIDHLMNVRNRVPLRNARVLEIASDHDLLFARGLLYLGARSVVASNIVDGFEAMPAHPGVERVLMDARELDCPEQSFDLVVGVAILEHMHDIPVALRSIARGLRPGGAVYLHGGPLWQGPTGHHVWVDGPSGRQYRFTGDNPVADWGHLLYDRAEMVRELVEAGCPQGDVDTIADWIYDDPALNRVPTRSIEQAFHDSPLEVVAMWHDRVPAPPRAIAERLTARTGADVDIHRVASITCLARRPN